MPTFLPAGARALALSLAAGAAPLITSPTQAQTGAQGPPSWAGEVVVTAARSTYAAPDTTAATRTDTPLIEVPQSVEVLTRSLLVEQDRRTLGDALVNVSGVTPTRPEEFLFTAPIVRGFPAEIYMDGLPLYVSQAANDPTSLVGVQQVDVLKGPNSTLYAGGVGTPLGGVINLESVRPTGSFGGYAALRGGSFGTIDPYFDVNAPLTHGVAARVTGEYQKNDSWIDELHAQRWSIQPSVSFRFGDCTELWLQGKADHRDQLEYSGIPALQALAGQIDRNAFPGAPVGQPSTVIDNRSATGELTHRLNDAVKLTLTGRWFHSESKEYGSFVYPDAYPPDPATPTAYPILPIYLDTPVTEYTLDANVQGKVAVLGGRHELLAGFDYDQTRFLGTLGFDGVPVGVLDLARPSYTLAFGAVPAINTTQTDRYQTIAGYLQDQATYGPLHLTGSVRFTQLRFQEMEEATDETFRRVSPRIGATLDVIPGVALYAAYATSFRGAFGVISATPPKPETSRNTEAGVKLALAPPAHLSGTLAVFDQTRRNVATPDPNDVHYSIQTGAQEAKGVEADLVWEPTPALSILANYAYTDARVSEDALIPVGDNLARVPQDSGRIAVRYRALGGAARGLGIGAGVTAVTSRPLTLPNTVSAPGYAALDAQASYDFDRFTVEVSAVNLTGAHAFDPYEYLGFPVVIPTQPRSAYVTFKARF